MDFLLYVDGKKTNTQDLDVPTIEDLQRNQRRGYNFRVSTTGIYIGMPLRDQATLQEGSLAYNILERNFPGFVETGTLSTETRGPNNAYGGRQKHTFAEEALKELDDAQKELLDNGGLREHLGDIANIHFVRMVLGQASTLGRNVVVEKMPKP